MTNYIALFISFAYLSISWGQNYAPAANEPGSTAIHMSSGQFINWATGIEVERGFVHIEDTTFESNGSNRTSFGDPLLALGQATGQAGDVVSLGDKGIATLTFDQPVANGPGFDFAIFENSFDDTFLEFAHVEVSSNGEDFVRFPSHSEVQSEVQIHGFGSTDPRRIYNLAGKYRGGYGTPFDLEELKDSSLVNVNQITHIRIIDVVGSIGDSATFDNHGNKINEPYPTPYESGGFDLEAVGVINQVAAVENHVNSSICFHPNPATDFIRIQNNKSVNKIVILNMLGDVVLERNNTSLLNLDLPSGIYNLKLVFDESILTKRLIIK